MKLMQSNPSVQVLYVLGWWAWCYRLPALITYPTVASILVMVCGTSQELVLHPSIGNLVLVAFGLGVSFIFAWITWRYLQSRASRIVLLPDRALLIVRTLNFTSRRIPIAALENVRYEEESNSDTDTCIPVLTVQVRGGLPITIDLQGRILDEQAFKAVFGYSSSKPPPAKQVVKGHQEPIHTPMKRRFRNKSKHKRWNRGVALR